MENYLRFFYGGSDQIITLASSFAVLLILSQAGGVLAGRQRPMDVDFIFGWGAVSGVFTIFVVFFAAPLENLFWCVVILSLIAAGALIIRDGKTLTPGLFRVFFITTPLLLIASAMEPSQWDEFSHWLPAPRFMLLTHDVPSLNNPVVGTEMLPAYPFGWPYLTYMASRISGTFVEGAGRILNIAFLLCFGLLVMRSVVEAAGYKRPQKLSWKMSGLVVLIVMLVNPTFIQKIILTAYADVSTSVTLAVIAYLYWTLLNSQASDNNKDFRWVIVQIALASIAFINIKQVNVALLFGLTSMYLLIAWRDPNINFKKSILISLFSLLPALTIYGVWRYHVIINYGASIGVEGQFLPFEDWNITKMHIIFFQMLIVASKKMFFFGIMAIAVGVGVCALNNIKTKYDRLAILVGGAFLTYNCFLYIIYITSFGEKGALAVMSFWRYNTHLGMLAVLFFATSMGMLWQRFNFKDKAPAIIFRLPLILVIIAPFVFAKKLRFDLEPLKPHYTIVARELALMIPKNEPIVFVDPLGTGESAVISRYAMNRSSIPYLSAFHGVSQDSISEITQRLGEQTWVLVHSLTPSILAFFQLPFKKNFSYLLSKKERKWKIIEKWPYSKALPM